MKGSAVKSAVGAISRYCHRNGLQDRGWQRRGNHFWRANEDLFYGIHFQTSWFGSSDEGSFTINLVVTAPLLFECWIGEPFPTNPATCFFPLSTRIGELMNVPGAKADHWWTVAQTTDVAALASEVSGLISSAAEPHFRAYPNIRTLARLEALNTRSRAAPLFLAVADYVSGDLQGARRHLLEGIRDRSVSDAEAVVRFRQAAARLGLAIDGDENPDR